MALASCDPPRYPLILNPKAKGEKARAVFRFVLEHSTRFAIYATRSRQEAIDLARTFAAEGEPLVVAAGGDGTLNAVVEGLAKSETSLGVLPTGTMNVFAREMGIPWNTLPEALAVIDGGHRKGIDVFTMNLSPFLQMAGVGFDAYVIEGTTWESKKRFGPLSYLMTAAKMLPKDPPILQVRTAEGAEDEGVFALVGNGALYGGQFRLFQTASNNDQLLDVILFKEAGLSLLQASLAGLARGGIGMDFPDGSVTYFKTGSLEILADREVPAEIDGDLWGRAKEFSFRREERALQVCAPETVTEPNIFRYLRGFTPW